MDQSKHLPIMPKATAVWLIENTGLTFVQIAEFCGIHELEVKCIADGEVSSNMKGMDPIASGQLTKEEIERCSVDPGARLQLSKGFAHDLINTKKKKKQTKYTPIARRHDKPDALLAA